MLPSGRGVRRSPEGTGRVVRMRGSLWALPARSLKSGLKSKRLEGQLGQINLVWLRWFGHSNQQAGNSSLTERLKSNITEAFVSYGERVGTRDSEFFCKDDELGKVRNSTTGKLAEAVLTYIQIKWTSRKKCPRALRVTFPMTETRHYQKGLITASESLWEQ